MKIFHRVVICFEIQPWTNYYEQGLKITFIYTSISKHEYKNEVKLIFATHEIIDGQMRVFLKSEQISHYYTDIRNIQDYLLHFTRSIQTQKVNS